MFDQLNGYVYLLVSLLSCSDLLALKSFKAADCYWFKIYSLVNISFRFLESSSTFAFIFSVSVNTTGQNKQTVTD